MKIYYIPIIVLATLSCTEKKETREVLKTQQESDTLDATIVQPDQGSKDLTIEFMNKNGSEDASRFYSGDVIDLKVNYRKKIKPLENNYKLGLIAKTKNITITRLTDTTFQIVIDRNNPSETFQFSPYIYSDNIVFTQAYHDTLDGFDKNPDGHSVELTSYVFPIQDKHKNH